MAKKTKFEDAKNNVNTNVVNGSDPTIATTAPVTLPSEVCNNTNTQPDVILNQPSVTDELEKFTILENNIVSPDDYVKFTELANVYNLFNKIELQKLNKDDLICLIGSVIDRLYKSEQQHKENTQALQDEIKCLNVRVQDSRQKTGMSVDTTQSYTDLMSDLGTYKSW